MSRPRILFIGAMNNEIRLLLSFYNCAEECKVQNIYPLWRSDSACEYDIYILQTFVGEVNACTATSIALCLINPEYVFKIGCVGANSKGLRIGDVIIPIGYFSNNSWITRSKIDNKPTSDASEWQSIFGDMPYQVSRDNLGGLPYFFKNDRLLLTELKQVCESKKYRLVPSFIGSGNMWYFDISCARNVSRSQIAYQGRDNTWVADMESFAVAQVCHVFNKKFMGFYRVSDNFLEDKQYKPENVSKLFDVDFIYTIDSLLQRVVSKYGAIENTR